MSSNINTFYILINVIRKFMFHIENTELSWMNRYLEIGHGWGSNSRSSKFLNVAATWLDDKMFTCINRHVLSVWRSIFFLLNLTEMNL